MRLRCATFEAPAQAALLLLLRLLYGGFFMQTGWGKLMNFERTQNFFASLGLPFPAVMAALAASTELLGGMAWVLGLGTRFAATALAFVMLVALASAHAAEAFASLESFTEQAPYPFLLASLLLLAFGAGKISLDARLASRCAPRR